MMYIDYSKLKKKQQRSGRMIKNPVIKLIDELYLILYAIILFASILLLLGVQDIIITFVPSWEMWYNLLQVSLIMLSAIGIYLNIESKRTEGYYFIILFTTCFAINAILQLSILLTSPIDGGILFRVIVNIFFTIALFYRYRMVREYIKEGL